MLGLEEEKISIFGKNSENSSASFSNVLNQNEAYVDQHENYFLINHNCLFLEENKNRQYVIMK